MANEQKKPPVAPDTTPQLQVAPGPHFGTTGRSTRWMMLDVLIGLLPAVVVSHLVFGGRASMVIGVSVVTCLVAEAIFQWMRGRPVSLADGSAAVTGLILALSLPWTVPWWIPLIGGFVAIGFGKMVFGGLGRNSFNPAMVGRAFLMICFATEMTTWALPGGVVPDGLTAATPLGAAKYGNTLAYGLERMFLGTINGSLGETSAAALLLGGLYLMLRRSAAWQIPVGVLLGAGVVASLQYLFTDSPLMNPLFHLNGGALLFGAFFIATDPVSSPLSLRGRWVFGLGVGILTMVIRLFAGYPEGVMFAVLLMNSVTPLINRYTVPRPVGGPMARPRPAPVKA